MLFNSLQFFVFFIIVYLLYLLSRHRRQNIILLVASYVFYAAWDWRFLSLIVLSTVVDYYCGLGIEAHQQQNEKKKFLFCSICLNLSLLGFFKYFNFFADNLTVLLQHCGVRADVRFLHVVLPVGISFYTFQTMSYTIDIYYGKLKATRRFFDFALFVAFFPQLIAGPIERAKHLLPQILAPRKVTLEQFYEGSFLIFWGLFQKVFVADNLARFVDPVFAWQGQHQAAVVLVTLYAFSFQIYCDFAGYSNIARGLGKCMGFDIMVNFRLPYFSKNPSEFWQRWHISLSGWLKDYLYIPLGGNRNGTAQTYRNLALTMLLGGLWHGASWLYVLWGIYQGSLLILHRLFNPLLRGLEFKEGSLRHKFWFWLRVICFYHLTCFGWLIFRAQSLAQIGNMLQALLSGLWQFQPHGFITAFQHIFPYIALLVLVQLWQYRKDDLMIVYRQPVLVRTVFYFICFISINIFGETGAKEFIYFQF